MSLLSKIDLSIYDSSDFGFTAVSDPDSLAPPPPPPQVNTEEISAPILDRINSLEGKMDEVLNIMERFEQIITPNLDTDEYKALIQKDVSEKLKKVEAMVMPLLMNLMKDAEVKEYIRWPNRKPTIESFIEKFLAVTRS
jgi:hypothetical protein